MKRRTYLAVFAGVAVAGCTTEQDDPSQEEDDEPPERSEAEREPPAIETAEQLIDRLESATEGDVIHVEPGTTIDLTGHWEIPVPAGVTLSGGRKPGVQGAVLSSPDGDKTPESETFIRKLELNEGARLTGFHLKGHFHDYVNAELEHDGDFYAHRGGGGVTAKKDTVVDNNEISGWPYAGVSASANAHVYNNYIHHNTWEGLGYGVTVPEGHHMPFIESNYFNYNRHSIAAGGGSEVGYVAQFNVVGEQWVGSQFDMHGSEGMEGVAGKRIVIRENTFKATKAVEAKTRNPGGSYYAIDIRGTPTEGAFIERNWFFHDDRESAVRQPNRFENVFFEHNHYGKSEPKNADIGGPQIRNTGKSSDPKLLDQ